jgi:hypothetical protein
MVDLLVEVKEPLSIILFSGASDPCVEQFVTLTLDFQPCTIAGCPTGCNCTYTVDWYKDGFLIGTSSNIPPSQATFTYTALPLAGNYYAVIKADCCPDEVQTSQVITFNPSCEPWVLGPCFICDGIPVTLCAHMVIPPSTPCPDFCTFEWFDGSGNSLGTTTCITVTQGGYYTLQSNCNGCIKSFTFYLPECQSAQLPPFLCGLVSVENILPLEESGIKLFPNPTTGELTVEWKEGAPKDTRLFITDLDGRRIRTFTVPSDAKYINISLGDLPAGLYFMKVQSADRMASVAKVVKE